MKSQEAQQQSYGRLILAIVLLLAGGAALFFGSHSFAIHAAGLLAIIASVYVIRSSQIRARSNRSATSRQEPHFKVAGRARRLGWAVAIGLLLALAASYLWVYNDAIHGGKSGLPAIVFAGVALVAGPVWGYLASRLFRRNS